ncbi:MAG TPA: hypothetical protein VMT32_07865 [Bryobacteraceae bacterium]|nr:hypothetical protein [Bryobacteraceae bacterium]
MGRAALDIPDGMRVLQGRFARWRKSHTGRLPIPDPLWAAAAEMAREHGVFRTAKVLSLEYGKLKRLTTASHPGRRRAARLSAPPAAFVELLTPGTGGAECLIELEGPRGKMRVQWKGSTTPDLAGLGRVLWESA